jgi:hypothetical protein
MTVTVTITLRGRIEAALEHLERAAEHRARAARHRSKHLEGLAWCAEVDARHEDELATRLLEWDGGAATLAMSLGVVNGAE